MKKSAHHKNKQAARNSSTANRNLQRDRPLLGDLKHARSIKLCAGGSCEVEIRETDSAVLIYLVGKISGAVDELRLGLVLQPVVQSYDSDPRPLYIIGDQVDYILRTDEVDGQLITTELSIEAGIAEIRGEAQAADKKAERDAKAEQGAEAPGMSFMIVRHDAWCPGVHGDGEHCICNAVPEFVDRETWIRSFTETGKRAEVRESRRGEGK